MSDNSVDRIVDGPYSLNEEAKKLIEEIEHMRME